MLAEQLDQEAVGMTGPDSVRVSSLVRKVFQVEGHDRVGTAADCRGENVPVLGIAPQLIDEVIEAVDQRFRAEGFTHHGDPATSLLGRHSDLRKVPLHLVQDRFRP